MNVENIIENIMNVLNFGGYPSGRVTRAVRV